MSCRQHRKSAAGPDGAHAGVHDRILLNYTRIENARTVRKKTFDFLLFRFIYRRRVNFYFSFFPAETLSNG